MSFETRPLKNVTKQNVISSDVIEVPYVRSDGQTRLTDGEALFQAFGAGTPENTIFAETQADIEAELTASLNVDAPGKSIFKTATFEQTTGYKIGLNASLYDQSSANIIDHSYKNAAEPMYANLNPANPIRDCRITGGRRLFNLDQDSILYDLVGTGLLPGVSATIQDNVQIMGFKNLGIIKDIQAFLVTASISFTNYLEYGWTVINSNFLFSNVQFAQGSPVAKRDAVAVFNDDSAGPIIISFVNNFFILPGEEKVWLDPLSHADSTFRFLACFALGDILKTGVDGTYSAAADIGGGLVRFTSTAHGILDGEPVSVTSLTGGAYSISRRAKNVTANTFELEIAFSATGTGDWTTTSLGAVVQDPRIMAVNNIGLADTKTAGEVRLNVEDLLITTVAQGVMEPIQANPPVADDFVVDGATKNFAISNLNGVMTLTALEDVEVEIKYNVTLSPATGGAQTTQTAIHINGIEQTKTNIEATTDTLVNYNGGIFELSSGDTVQLYRSNNTNTNDTLANDLKILITET